MNLDPTYQESYIGFPTSKSPKKCIFERTFHDLHTERVHAEHFKSNDLEDMIKRRNFPYLAITSSGK